MYLMFYLDEEGTRVYTLKVQDLQCFALSVFVKLSGCCRCISMSHMTQAPLVAEQGATLVLESSLGGLQI